MWSSYLAKKEPDINVIAVNPGSLLNTNMVIDGFLYLTCEYCGNFNNDLRANAIYGSKVSPYQLIQTLEKAIDELK